MGGPEEVVGTEMAVQVPRPEGFSSMSDCINSYLNGQVKGENLSESLIRILVIQEHHPHHETREGALEDDATTLEGRVKCIR